MILLSDGDLQWYIRGYFSHTFSETPITILRQNDIRTIMLFDAHQLADFVQQFPCPICQRTGYDATGSTMGFANIVLLTCVFKWQILALEDTIHMDSAF